MKEISIKNIKILIDDDDFERLSKFKWSLGGGRTKDKNRYPCVSINGRTNYIHRMVLGLKKGDKRFIDHIDRNTYNNQKSNLRIVSRSQNRCNSDREKSNKSGYKGIHWRPQNKKWYVQIAENGKVHYLGLYEDLNEAIRIYNEASLKYHGKFGFINNIK